MQLEHLVIYDRDYVDQLINFRQGETKLGEKIVLCQNQAHWQNEIEASSAQFVLLGLPEDIGVQGNLGRKGAQDAWESALSAILNIQNNRYLEGTDIFLLGHLNFKPLIEEIDDLSAEDTDRTRLIREKTAIIDEWVSQLIRSIVEVGKIPLVVGGGHNNAYGCLKGSALGKGKAVNAVNLDPHADYRSMEGRHSGNGFRYAKEEGYLRQYCILGAHEGYNSENMLQEIAGDEHVQIVTFEDLFIRNQKDFNSVLKNLSNKWHEEFTGIEIDLDCMANLPVSAYSPSGFLLEDVRRFIHYSGSQLVPAYLHLCEGAPTLGETNAHIKVGKTIAYLVADFIKAVKSKA
jgi:formiminoglutamase